MNDFNKTSQPTGLDVLISHNDAYTRALKTIREYWTTLQSTAYPFFKRTEFELATSVADPHACEIRETFLPIIINDKSYNLSSVYNRPNGDPSEEVIATFILTEKDADGNETTVLTLQFGKGEKGTARPTYSIHTSKEAPYRRTQGIFKSDTWKEASDDFVTILETAAPALYLSCVEAADKTPQQRERALRKRGGSFRVEPSPLPDKLNP